MSPGFNELKTPKTWSLICKSSWSNIHDGLSLFCLKDLCINWLSSGCVVVILIVLLWGSLKVVSTSCKFAHRWMSQTTFGDKSTLVQVMAWWRQAASHYLSQCWSRCISLSQNDLNIRNHVIPFSTHQRLHIRARTHNFDYTYGFAILFLKNVVGYQLHIDAPTFEYLIGINSNVCRCEVFRFQGAGLLWLETVRQYVTRLPLK